MSSGEGEIAFVELPVLPTYKPVMLKKNIKTNDDEIFEKVKATGTAYYKYFAITEDDEEKKYVKTFAEAEDVVNKLKDKDSTNKDKLAIVEKYAIKKVSNDAEKKEETDEEKSEEGEEKKEESSEESDDLKSTGEAAGLPQYDSIELADVDSVVKDLYKKRIVYTYSNWQAVSHGAVVPTDLGVTLMAPVSGLISSGFGIRARDNHPGLDIAAPTGTSIFAAAGGTVVAAGYTAGYGGYGNIVVIKSTESLSIRYGHCSAVFVSVGQQVTQGQCIAAVGSTGMSTGPHLHFEIRYNGATVNPQLYLYR